MNNSKNKSGVIFDILLLLTLLIFSALVSSAYISEYMKKGIKLDFYQNTFSPAVLDACGRGFKVPILKGESRLKEFLFLKHDHFSCNDLEENFPIKVGYGPLTGQTQYLMKLVAFIWSIRGISWSALAPLFSFFYSINIVLLYCIFRLGMGRGIAFAGSIILSISWIHLTYLPHLRDYSKATFLLGSILLMSCLLKKGSRRMEIILFSAGFGLVTGIGLGFRQDILICFPPFIVTLFFFLPGGINSNLRAKFEGLILSLILLIISGWGPLHSMENGQNGWHASVLGLAPNFTNALGLKESIYQWVGFYDDLTVQSMASIYSYKKDLVYALLSTSHYDKVTAELFLEVVKLFPADFFVRILGSLVSIINIASIGPEKQPLNSQSLLSLFFQWRQGLISPLMNWGLWIVILTLLLQSAYKLRFAIFSSLFLFYFSAVQTLQFHVRHHFYLEFIFWWCLGFIFYQAWIFILKPIMNKKFVERKKVSWGEFIWTKEQWLKKTSIPLKFGGIVLFIIIGSLFSLREYQEGRLKEIFLAYEKAQIVPLKWQAFSKSHNTNIIEVKEFFDKNYLWPIQNYIAYSFQYLVVEFHPQCESSRLFGKVSATFNFGFQNEVESVPDLSKSYEVILPYKETKPTRVFYPVHNFNDARGLYTFKGLGLNPRDMACFKNIYEVKNPLDLSPLNIILTLPPDWESRQLFLSLK